FMGKVAVSALLFDYVLTGPISSVTAGQYLVSFVLEILARTVNYTPDKEAADNIKALLSVIFACSVTLYFYRQNVVGIHESSDKAFKIMIATTIMAAIMIAWCGATLAINDKVELPPIKVDLQKKTMIDEATREAKPIINKVTGKQEDPLG